MPDSLVRTTFTTASTLLAALALASGLWLMATTAAAEAATAPADTHAAREPLERISGADRFETAARIAESRYGSEVETVYVTSGATWPDALAAGAAAGASDMPLLLVLGDAVPAATLAALERLDPARIVIAGGEAAVSSAVADELGALLGSSDAVERVRGATRFETAVQVSQHRWDRDAGGGVVFVASGTGFADAIAGAPAAAANDAPLLLSQRDVVPAATLAEIRRHDPSEIFLLGGSAVLGGEVERALAAEAPTTRLSGPERFATAAAISAHLRPGGADHAWVGTGRDFPDVLAAAPVAGAEGAPVLLSERDALPEATGSELARLAPSAATLIGGANALTAQVEQQVADLLIGSSGDHLFDPDTRQSTPAVIADALARGDIDHPTSLRYRMYALFGDPRLPDEFVGDLPDGRDHVFAEVQRTWEDLPADTRDALAPFLARPTAPDSAWTAAANSTSVAADATAQGSHVCPADDWRSAAADVAHVRVWLCASDDADDQASLSTVADTFDELWPAMTEDLPNGLGEPLPDLAAAADHPDSDDRVDVYLLDGAQPTPERLGSGDNLLDEDGNRRLGVAVGAPASQSSNSTTGGWSGYILLARELVADADQLELNAIHELFHVQQYRYSHHEASDAFGEQTAKWAETYYAPHLARTIHDSWFLRGFRTSEKSLEEAEYEGYVWPLYMQQEAGPQAVFQAYAAAEGATTPQGVVQAVDGVFPYAPGFAEFAMRTTNRNLPGQPLPVRYRDLPTDISDADDERVYARRFHALDRDEGLTVGGIAPRGLSMRMDRVDVAADYDQHLIDVTVPPVPDDVAVEALAIDAESGHAERIDLDADAFVCGLAQLWIVTSNASLDAEPTDAFDIGLEPTDEPCTNLEIDYTGDISGQVRSEEFRLGYVSPGLPSFGNKDYGEPCVADPYIRFHRAPLTSDNEIPAGATGTWDGGWAVDFCPGGYAEPSYRFHGGGSVTITRNDTTEDPAYLGGVSPGLVQGTASFQVTQRPERDVIVEADLTVRFSVEHDPAPCPDEEPCA